MRLFSLDSPRWLSALTYKLTQQYNRQEEKLKKNRPTYKCISLFMCVIDDGRIYVQKLLCALSNDAHWIVLPPLSAI